MAVGARPLTHGGTAEGATRPPGCGGAVVPTGPFPRAGSLSTKRKFFVNSAWMLAIKDAALLPLHTNMTYHDSPSDTTVSDTDA